MSPSSVHDRRRLENMKITFAVLSVALVVFAALNGCSQDAQTPNDPVSIIRENIRAMNDEDLDGMMATIDEQSPSYDQTKQMSKKLFEMYDLKYELDSLKIVTQTEDEARLECVQTTTKIKGPAFRDNKIAFIHSLKKSEGHWKIYYSKIVRLDYLN
jgi:hypothetical protein